MTTTTEYGYLGSLSMESGAGIARQPTLVNGEPIYTPYAEDAWAKELVGADGRFRFLSGGTAAGRGNANALDAILADNFTVLALTRADSSVNFAQSVSKGAYGSSEFWALCSTGNFGTGPLFNVKHSPANGSSNPVGVSPTTSRRQQVWQWIAGQRVNLGGTNNTLNVWADGIKRSAVDGIATNLANVSNLSIDPVTYKVKVACVLIYSRVLTDAEVANIMSGKSAPASIAGLAAYYKFNEVSGTQCTDYSGQGNHLTYSQDYAKISEEWSPDGNQARAFSPAWYTPAGFSIAAGKLNLNNPAASSGAVVVTPTLMKGQRYTVSFTLSGVNASTSVRITLYAQDATYQVTTAQSANGTYTESFTINGGSGSQNGAIMVQAQNSTTVCTVSNVSVVPDVTSGGQSGQPYVTRTQRPMSNGAGNMFRPAPSLPAAAAQGCLLVGAGAMMSAPDSPSLRLAGDHTVTGWVKFTGNGVVTLWNKNTVEGRVDLSGYGKNISIQRNGQSANFTLPFALPPSAWAFIAVAFNVAAGLAYFYVNGSYMGSKAFTPGNPTFTTNAANIGATSAAGRPSYVRSIRVFSRTLSASDIDSLFLTDSYPRTDASLVGEWLCNEPWNSLARDTSQYANHASLLSGNPVPLLDSPYFLPRRKMVGKQIGIGAYNSLQVQGLPAALSGASVITLTGRVKTPNAAQSQGLLMLQAPNASKTMMQLYRNAAGWYQAAVYRSTADSVAYSNISRMPSIDSQYHHLALEFDCVAKTVKVWVDGIMVLNSAVASTTGAAFDFAGEPSLKIAFPNNGTVNRTIWDELRIYRRALTDVEHRNLFLGMPAPRDSLVAEYTFDSDSTNAQDSSGNGLHATWMGVSSANYVQER